MIQKIIIDILYIGASSRLQAYVPEPDVDVQVKVSEVPPISYRFSELASVIVGVATE